PLNGKTPRSIRADDHPHVAGTPFADKCSVARWAGPSQPLCPDNWARRASTWYGGSRGDDYFGQRHSFVRGIRSMVNTLLTPKKIAPRAPAPRLQSIEMYESMLLARALDERMWILNRQGRASFVISCQGHEAAQAGVAYALVPGRDVIFPYYRDVGVVLRF